MYIRHVNGTYFPSKNETVLALGQLHDTNDSDGDWLRGKGLAGGVAFS